MNYIFYKSKHGNFGDDLNDWLWPRLIPENDSDICLLGIGSILFDENPSLKAISTKSKVVFGTGIRPTADYSTLTVDPLWNILFLRGPLSAGALDNKYQYITDAAYALRQIDGFDQYLECEKEYEVSLMPYFKSLDYFNWPEICKELGFHYISPLSENGVEFTIKEIAKSKKLITEAMHGAIVADILRVPWHRFVFTTPFTEGGRVSDFKWRDWLLSIDIPNTRVTYIPFYTETRINAWVRKLTNQLIHAQFLLKKRVLSKLKSRLASVDSYYLSEDRVIRSIDEKIADKLKELHDLAGISTSKV
jgi:succinoglycan biosynthesis protein ExoV